MPRQRRIEYAGAIYHLMSRGNQRKAIFLDEADCHDFLMGIKEGVIEAIKAFSYVKTFSLPW